MADLPGEHGRATDPPSGDPASSGLPTADLPTPHRPTADLPTADLVTARGLTRRFGELVAVDDVDLDVAPGQIVGLLGANGAGKTTLLRMLLGLLPPTAGDVTVLGAAPSRESQRRIGYVPQNLGLYADLTVEQNLEFVAGCYGAPTPALPPGLAELATRPVSSIGLGRQRRLAFVAALAHAPALLVLDEPTSGVDPLARARLWDTLHEQADHGTGVLVTTHYVQEAEQCDRLLLIVAGRAVATGTVAEIVGDIRAVRVLAPAWQDAFVALADAGLPVVLDGTAVRVADVATGAVAAALAAAGVAADLVDVPATLEEAMAAAAGPDRRS